MYICYSIASCRGAIHTFGCSCYHNRIFDSSGNVRIRTDTDYCSQLPVITGDKVRNDRQFVIIISMNREAIVFSCLSMAENAILSICAGQVVLTIVELKTTQLLLLKFGIRFYLSNSSFLVIIYSFDISMQLRMFNRP